MIRGIGTLVQRYPCPRCGERTIGFWQKQLAGADARVRCSHCGARLAVPLARSSLAAAAATLATVLVAVLIYAAWVRFTPQTQHGIWQIYGVLLAGVLIGGAVAVWARHRFVPLVCKDA
jgi:DNA-directed RNA polymerase subunit RPC12/RpoP